MDSKLLGLLMGLCYLLFLGLMGGYVAQPLFGPKIPGYGMMMIGSGMMIFAIVSLMIVASVYATAIFWALCGLMIYNAGVVREAPESFWFAVIMGQLFYATVCICVFAKADTRNWIKQHGRQHYGGV